jgi:hypothetical protein
MGMSTRKILSYREIAIPHVDRIYSGKVHKNMRILS